ncbi:MAG: hypothetical protein J0L81_03845 [Caulobacterales bacterium]|jgi:hypothetical protein|nr:hypothetical protein [Caulobacterales bacterium]
MRVLVIAGALALLAACAPAEEQDVMSEGCDARGVGAWNIGAETFSVEGATSGPDCTRAVATLVVRNASGEPVWADAHIAADIMVLAPAHDIAAMNTALGEWTANGTAMQSTTALPEWPPNADSPQNGEFPFYLNEGYTRESYNAMRAANYPMFCYVQGMESMRCIIHGESGVEWIGVQSFPG